MRSRRLLSAIASCTVVLSGCGSEVAPESFIRVGASAGAEAPRVPDSTSGGGPATGGPLTGVSNHPGAAGGSATRGDSRSGAGATGPDQAAHRSATSGIAAGSCAGFRNGTGITDSSIAVGNVVDRTGPVPGLFTAAQQAVRAYAAYFNSASSVCGRKLKVIGYDSQTSSFGDQEGATSACAATFAMVGSVSAFDDGGAKAVTDCGIPDLRTISTSPARVASPVSFGTDSVDPRQVSTAQYRFIKNATGTASTKTAMLYLNAGAAVPNATAYRKTMESLGYHFVMNQAIDVASFNYAPYAAKIKSLGVTLVQFEGTYQYAVRLKQAMANQGVHPVFVMDSVAYDPVFVAAGGSAFNGMYSYVNTALFEERSRSPEMQLYLSWLHRVAPSAQPSFFGMFAWGATELFAELAVRLGGKLDRSSLLRAIKATRKYTAHGLFAPQNVGTKHSPNCQAVIQLENGAWVRRSPYPYSCSDVFDTR